MRFILHRTHSFVTGLTTITKLLSKPTNFEFIFTYTKIETVQKSH